RSRRQGAERPRGRHRVDDQRGYPVSRTDADARGQGNGRAGAIGTRPHDGGPAVKSTVTPAAKRPTLEVSTRISAPSAVVLKAFFEAGAPAGWGGGGRPGPGPPRAR